MLKNLIEKMHHEIIKDGFESYKNFLDFVAGSNIVTYHTSHYIPIANARGYGLV